MGYFYINNHDYSAYVSKLKVGTKHKYKGMENAAGNLLVKHQNKKKIIEVGIIPLDNETLKMLLTDINNFEVEVTYLEPSIQALKIIKCIIPDNAVDYYSIRAGNVMTQAFSLTFTEK